MALTLSLGLICAGSASPAAARAVKPSKHPKPAQATQVAQAWPEDVTQMAAWVIATDDNGGRPFVVIDKVAAKVFVFRANGQLRGAAPALLGSAQGDNSTPGVGDRELSAIAPDDRTTPAGRFVASFGSTPGQRKVLWVDYTTAISMHPVVTAHPKERRPQRLKSPTPRDNRITYGCINVSDAFYQKVVRRTFTGATGIVYILPEKAPLAEVFPAYRTVASTAAPGDRNAARDLQEPKEAGVSDAAASAQSAAALAR